MLVEEAEAVAHAATWVALNAALDAHRDAIAAVRELEQRLAVDGVTYQEAILRVQAAQADVRTCWLLHFGRPLSRNG
jgi:hypothetical protein